MCALDVVRRLRSEKSTAQVISAFKNWWYRSSTISPSIYSLRRTPPPVLPCGSFPAVKSRYGRRDMGGIGDASYSPPATLLPPMLTCPQLFVPCRSIRRGQVRARMVSVSPHVHVRPTRGRFDACPYHRYPGGIIGTPRHTKPTAPKSHR